MIELSTFSTLPPSEIEKEVCKAETQTYIEQLPELQNKLYAQSKYAVLILLQGMDASGKDGVVREIFSGVNPMGCSVKSFKAPSSLEKSYDFLWRVHQVVPQKGMIGIFNRSHYEDVLVPVVEGWIDEAQKVRRYEYINQFEDLLWHENNTLVLKYFLHISQEKQHERLMERIKDPTKQWKYDGNDFLNSAKWEEYQKAYNSVFNHCSKNPWTIVPSDKKWYKEHIIAKDIVNKLKELPLAYPGIS